MKHPDEFVLRYTDHGSSEHREFVGGRDFRIDHRAISRVILRPLTSRMVDLLRIAASVYFIDRLIRRDRKHGPQGWARRISCSIEVREPQFWAGSPVSELIHEALQFVSGDRWNFEFFRAALDDNYVCVWQHSIDPDHLGQTRRVCLYSGGLDSAAGLVKRVIESPRSVTLAVNLQHRTDLGSTVNEQLRQMSKHTRAELRPVVVPFEMDAPKGLVRCEETSQRTRAFLFVATGGVVAGAADSTELEVFESGIGAINVPLLAGMEGSQATRGTHPRFLGLMSRLLEHVIGQRVDVNLPFMDLTKGDVVRSLNCDVLKEIANSTISCAHFPIRHEKGGGWKSCGLCPACIFRRVAFHAAGIEEPCGVYQHDLLDPRSSQLSPKKLRYLMAYLLQIDSLTELDAGTLPPLVTRHLKMTNVMQSGEPQQMYVDLFRRYRTEWYGLLEQARRNGCALARRIDLPGHAA